MSRELEAAGEDGDWWQTGSLMLATVSSVCWTGAGCLYDKCVSVAESWHHHQPPSRQWSSVPAPSQPLTSSAWTRAARAAVSATITFSCSRGGVTTATTAPPPAITSGGGAESPRAGAVSSCGAGARCENSARLRSREVV